MSLPSAEQRALDGIADSLRVSEPRLAAMYDTFTKLTIDDPPHGREQLMPPAPLARVAALCDRLQGSPTRAGRHVWTRALALCEVAIVLIVLIVLVGLTTGPASACRVPRLGHAAAAPAGKRCPRLPVSAGYPLGW